MKGLFLARHAMQFVLDKYPFESVLDIGSGEGLHAEVFRKHGKRVVTLDSNTHWGKPDILADFTEGSHEIMNHGPFDLWWCSHVLEHQCNPGVFLDVLFNRMHENDILAITVPPAKHEIVGGHVTIWNAGLLLYNLILARFDCSKAHVKQHEYNISVVMRKKSIDKLPDLVMDSGDIEKLAPYFPMPVKQGFNGLIKEVNWK